MMTLQVPSMGIQLRNPEFRDIRQVRLRMRTRRNILGTLHTFVRQTPYWILEFTVTGCNKYKIWEWHNFCNLTAGSLMTLKFPKEFDDGSAFEEEYYGNLMDVETNTPFVERHVSAVNLGARDEVGNIFIRFEGNKIQ